MDLKFRTLYADEIDVRIGSVNRGGVNLLLYKDARCDMSILDEHVGSLNWKREHEVIDGKLFCSVSIYDPEKKEWISKSDVGTESFTEKEKGESSDSFKRACVNWGIYRKCTFLSFVQYISVYISIHVAINCSNSLLFTSFFLPTYQ